MNLNKLTLAFNLWFGPAVLFALALFVRTMADQLQSNPLAGLVPLVTFASFALFAVAIVWGLWSVWKIWQSENGIGELCHNCGGPTRLISPGRYSPHYRCMACGANRGAEC
jgi:hypothetical protein